MGKSKEYWCIVADGEIVSGIPDTKDEVESLVSLAQLEVWSVRRIERWGVTYVQIHV